MPTRSGCEFQNPVPLLESAPSVGVSLSVQGMQSVHISDSESHSSVLGSESAASTVPLSPSSSVSGGSDSNSGESLSSSPTTTMANSEEIKFTLEHYAILEKINDALTKNVPLDADQRDSEIKTLLGSIAESSLDSTLRCKLMNKAVDLIATLTRASSKLDKSSVSVAPQFNFAPIVQRDLSFFGDFDKFGTFIIDFECRIDSNLQLTDEVKLTYFWTALQGSFKEKFKGLVESAQKTKYAEIFEFFKDYFTKNSLACMHQCERLKRIEMVPKKFTALQLQSYLDSFQTVWPLCKRGDDKQKEKYRRVLMSRLPEKIIDDIQKAGEFEDHVGPVLSSIIQRKFEREEMLSSSFSDFPSTNHWHFANSSPFAPSQAAQVVTAAPAQVVTTAPAKFVTPPQSQVVTNQHAPVLSHNNAQVVTQNRSNNFHNNRHYHNNNNHRPPAQYHNNSLPQFNSSTNGPKVNGPSAAPARVHHGQSAGVNAINVVSEMDVEEAVQIQDLGTELSKN